MRAAPVLLGVASLASFAAATVAATAILSVAPPAAEASPAPIDRFRQVRIGETSIAVAVDSNDSLRCVSVVTGQRGAQVTVAIGASQRLRNYAVSPRRETGCIAEATRTARPGDRVYVPPDAYLSFRATVGGAITRVRLP